MTKVTLTDLGSLTGLSGGVVTTINTNNDLIERAIDNTISRDGSSPNEMGADLDLNDNDILNAGTLNANSINVQSLFIGGLEAVPTVVGGVPVFASRSAVASYSTDVAPSYIKTEGYSNAGDGGGALYGLVVSQPTHQGKVSLTLSGGGIAWYEIDRAETNAKQFGAVETSTNASVAIQAFFDHATSVRVGVAKLFGDYNIATGLTLNCVSTTTINFEFGADLRALGAIDTMMTFNNGTQMTFGGQLRVWGVTSTVFGGRTCRRGIFISNCGRARFGRLYARYFSQWGVVHDGQSGNNSLLKHDAINAIYCGPYDGRPLSANFSGATNSGSSGSTGQNTLITVDVMPPTDYDVRQCMFVVINGQLYNVAPADFDDINKTLNIYPWLDSGAGTSGSLYYIFGGGLASLGSDNNIIDLGQIDVQQSGIALWDGALYGAVTRGLVAQDCGIGLIIGRTITGSHVTSRIDGFYCESNTFDLVRMTTAPVTATIAGIYETSYTKMVMMPSARSGTNAMIYGALGNGLNVIASQVYTANKSGNNQTDGSSFLTFPHKNADVYKRDSWTVNLTFDTDINRVFGYDAMPLIVYGTGADSRPTGTFTFNPPVGWTVNGGASAAFAGFSGPVHFSIKFILATLDVLIVLVSGRESGPNITTLATNANANITPWLTYEQVIHTGTLTADRTLTLVTTNAVAGKTKFRITRTGSGAFNLIVGGLKNLVQNTWCDVVYNGSAFVLSAYGAL